MRDRTQIQGNRGLFLAARLGLPGGMALLGLFCSAVQHSYRGWWLLLSVACLAEMGPAFRQGQSYLRHRASLVRWEGQWVRALRPLARFLGLEDPWIRSFLAWNNHRVTEALRGVQARRALVLLPHCIQMSRCRAAITEDLENCHRCGQCVLGDTLEASLKHRWEVHVSNRSHKAVRRALEYKPDLIVAVSCADRLLKGILKLPEMPTFAIPLDLPLGMCVDTRFDPTLLERAMQVLVRPRSEPASHIRPLKASEIA